MNRKKLEAAIKLVNEIKQTRCPTPRQGSSVPCLRSAIRISGSGCYRGGGAEVLVEFVRRPNARTKRVDAGSVENE